MLKAIVILALIRIFMELVKNGYNELVLLHLILIVLIGILIEIREGKKLEWA